LAKQNISRRGFDEKPARARDGKEPKQAPKQSAPSSDLELDRLIHEKLRLGILSALAVNSTLTFNDLKKLLSTSDGNLSVHARKLEEADYIACEKSFEGRMPKTEYRLTSAGRKALERYLDEMESLIKSTRNPAKK
jgi:DNA-binding HxlR family transcriptional regulator